jgi:hypothetical protein
VQLSASFSGYLLATLDRDFTKFLLNIHGNQLTMTDSTGTTVTTYDEENRVTSKEIPYIGKAV